MAAIDLTLRKARNLARSGEKAAAAALYLDVLERFPKNRRAQSGLSDITKINTPAEAARLNQGLGQIKELVGRGHWTAAMEQARALVATAPYVPELHNELGTIYFSMSMGDEAEASYAEAHKLAPHHPDFAANYGALLVARDNELAAIPIFEAVLAKHPDHLGARRGLGRAYLGLGNCDAAIAAFDTVLAAQPLDADIQSNRATAHFSLGNRTAAVADMRRARSVDPARVEFMRMYCHMTKVAEGDPVIPTMEAALSKCADQPQDLLRLHFALGKVRHGLGEHKAAFTHWHEANRIYKAERKYDFSQDAEQFAALKQVAARPIPPLNVPAASRRRPIFVVGMPRSGTSLVEQILSSHPQIYGAGEIPDLAVAVIAAGGLTKPLSPEALADIRAQYLGTVAAKTPDTPWTVDKMTVNFRLIGTIAAALPDAKIIHIRRDPMATCWSNFRNFFPTGGSPTDFGNDLTDLGRYWRLYDELMGVWEQSYPGLICHLRYEDLVADHESWTRSMLAHIGVEWDPACLRFHENRRAVLTTSADQVRRKLYSGSSEDWRVYESFLEPLRAALEV